MSRPVISTINGIETPFASLTACVRHYNPHVDDGTFKRIYQNAGNALKKPRGHTTFHGSIIRYPDAAQEAPAQTVVMATPQVVVPETPLVVDPILATLEGNIEIRASDGFVNATRLCQFGGKRWNDFVRLDSTTYYLNEQTKTGIPVFGLIDSNHGGLYAGTWVHPKLATYLAEWISPAFAVAVHTLVSRYVTGQVSSDDGRVPTRCRRPVSRRRSCPRHSSASHRVGKRLYV